jgi:hypothetical protein
MKGNSHSVRAFESRTLGREGLMANSADRAVANPLNAMLGKDHENAPPGGRAGLSLAALRLGDTGH